MRPRFGLTLGFIFAGLTWWLFHRARIAFAAEEIGGGEAVLYLGGAIVLSVATGIVIVTAFLPAVGEIIGNFFFSPNTQLDRTAQDKAREALERGDSEKALRYFHDALAAEPGDILSISEIARLLCEHRHDPAAAREFLEETMRQRDWTSDDLAFLLLRLAWVCAHDAHDPARAREVWQGIVLAYPGTRFAEQAVEEIAALDTGSAADPESA